MLPIQFNTKGYTEDLALLVFTPLIMMLLGSGKGSNSLSKMELGEEDDEDEVDEDEEDDKDELEEEPKMVPYTYS